MKEKRPRKMETQVKEIGLKVKDAFDYNKMGVWNKKNSNEVNLANFMDQGKPKFKTIGRTAFTIKIMTDDNFNFEIKLFKILKMKSQFFLVL